MSVREYVGARYVPIIVGEWDKTHTYEPLMVVTYQGASYTSRQYVPAGIEITNESYWVLSANYNAQVEAYRKEVRDILPYDETPTEGSTKGVTSDGIKKAINTAEQTNATAIANEITRAKTAEQVNTTAIANEVTRAKTAEQVNATTIATETTNRESADTAIRGQITEVSAKNSVMVVIGDSWSAPEDGYTKWHKKVGEYLGMTVDNFAVGGSGFVSKPGDTFSEQLDRVHTKYANNPDAIGKIYVQGMVNDLYNDITTIRNAYHTFDAKFASYFPDKGYEFVSASLFPDTTESQINTLITLYNEIVLSSYGSLTDVIGRVTAANLQSDGRHPANSGYMQLASAICGTNYFYAAPKSAYFTNGFSEPVFSSKITVMTNNFSATYKPITWHIVFNVKNSDTSSIDGLIDWSNNPLLSYFIRMNYTNPIPIYKDTGSVVGYLAANSYTKFSATFATPVQPSDHLRVCLSILFH